MWNYPNLDSQIESNKSQFVKIVADSLNYVAALWFVIVPSISQGLRATKIVLDRNHMVMTVLHLSENNNVAQDFFK